jgi:hypothetical protein
MSNQLDGIKERNDHMYGHRKSELLPILAGDYIGLRSEVERLKKENDYHMKKMKEYEKQAVHLAAVNDQLRDDNNANNALLDSLYLIAPEKIDEAIDMQKAGDGS